MGVIYAFYSSTSDKIYVGDITYISTRQGWLYLAVVIDVYSRKVVGWSMDDSMKTSLVNDALTMAIKRRKPEKQSYIINFRISCE